MSELFPVVAEIQGLYGPFSFSEKLLQKIWLRGDFDRAAARTTDGRMVRIIHPGKWNLLGGPDFKGARLRLGDGPEITGEVELHLHATDWESHGHSRDRAYDGVVLHVVLFPPDENRRTRGAQDRVIPVLALLPLLHHDLEEFAAEDAVAAMAGRAAERIPEELAALSAPELDALLQRHALKRWEQKVRYARLRVERLGWDQACHCTALEILGFRFNRAAMLQVAARWSLAAWSCGEVACDEVFASMQESGAWSLQGVRPANHPRTRLRQYEEWMRARPEWPVHLKVVSASLPVAEASKTTRGERRLHRFTRVRAALAEEICADALSGTRLDTWVCDGVLPLLAALDSENGSARWFGLWMHWFPGDLPPVITRGLRELGVFAVPVRPASHGAAQGMLGWWWEREVRK